MPDVILLNKPYGVICQFSAHASHPTLKQYVDQPGFYPAGRLDTESEGLLALTNDGKLQHRISAPRWKFPKTYWVQVEGLASEAALHTLCTGVDLGDYVTQPARVEPMAPPALWPRVPPIRFRKQVADTWLAITLCEGKNRQVRRMTAKVGLPTLRLVRVAIGPWSLGSLLPGQWERRRVCWDDLAAAGS